jgi:APA family basic amino acid/polyamine antiporter
MGTINTINSEAARSDSMQVHSTAAPPAGTLNLMALYCLSIGQVIGAGVITLVGPAIAMTGYSAWLAYFFAIILGFLTVLPVVFVTSTIRMAGGFYSLIAAVTDKRVAGMYAVSQLTNMFSLSLFGVALGLYINSVIPSIPPILCGIVLLTFFYVINLFGINFMARAQTYMTWILIASLLIFAFVGIRSGTNPIFDFSDPSFMTNGLGGITSAMLLYVYSCSGYSLTMNYGRDAKNAKRDIPLAIILSVPTIMLLYCGVAMAGTIVLPLEEVANKPLTLVARAVMHPALFAAFIICGPVMALTTTMNSSMPAQCIPTQRSCQDGWFPKSFGAPNRFGAPWKILTLNWLLGLVPMLLGWNVTVITNNVMLLSSLQALLYFYAYYKIPTKFPEAWKKARFHVPNGVYYFLISIGLVARLAILVNSFRSLTLTIALVSLLAVLVCFVYGFVRAKSPEVNLMANVWADD